MGTPKQDAALRFYESMRGLNTEQVFAETTLAGYTGKGVSDPELRKALDNMVSDVNRQAVEGAGLKGEARERVIAGTILLKIERQLLDPEVRETIDPISMDIDMVMEGIDKNRAIDTAREILDLVKSKSNHSLIRLSEFTIQEDEIHRIDRVLVIPVEVVTDGQTFNTEHVRARTELFNDFNLLRLNARPGSDGRRLELRIDTKEYPELKLAA